MFALSLQLLVGGTGLVSLAHAAFFGVGAYAVPVAGAGAFGAADAAGGGCLAGLAALAVGALALRTRGFFFLMTTLAFGQMLFFLYHDTPLGGGADGVFVSRPTLSAFGLDYAVGRRDRPAVMLLVNLAVLVAMYAGLAALLRTLFGRALLGIRPTSTACARWASTPTAEARLLRRRGRAGRGGRPHVGDDRGVREPGAARLAPFRRGRCSPSCWAAWARCTGRSSAPSSMSAWARWRSPSPSASTWCRAW